MEVKASNDLLWVDKVNETFDLNIMDSQAHLLGGCSSHGLVRAKELGDKEEAVRVGQLPDSDAHPLLWSEGLPDAIVQVLNVGE